MTGSQIRVFDMHFMGMQGSNISSGGTETKTQIRQRGCITYDWQSDQSPQYAFYG